MFVSVADLNKKLTETGLSCVLIKHNGVDRTIYIESRQDPNGNFYLAWSFDKTTWRPFA